MTLFLNHYVIEYVIQQIMTTSTKSIQTSQSEFGHPQQNEF